MTVITTDTARVYQLILYVYSSYEENFSSDFFDLAAEKFASAHRTVDGAVIAVQAEVDELIRWCQKAVDAANNGEENELLEPACPEEVYVFSIDHRAASDEERAKWGIESVMKEENWFAKPTGDMTLSVLDENGLQIVKVDMLADGTMKAEMDGNRLARRLNDLTMIASFGGEELPERDDLPYPDDGISPLPWSSKFDGGKRTLVIKDGKNKKIADRKFGKNVSDARVTEIVRKIETGIERLNGKA